jgi:hypothetical protein
VKRVAFALAGVIAAVAAGNLGGCGSVCSTSSQLRAGTFTQPDGTYGLDHYTVVLDDDFSGVHESFDLDGHHWERTYRVVSFQHIDAHN